MKKQITDLRRKRDERNEKIKQAYKEQMNIEGSMSSKVVAKISKSYRLTTQAVYGILKLKEDK